MNSVDDQIRNLIGFQSRVVLNDALNQKTISQSVNDHVKMIYDHVCDIVWIRTMIVIDSSVWVSYVE